MKIGIFDSGVGGKSFIEPTRDRFPEAEIIYKEDKDNVPYGGKSAELLLELTQPIFKKFEKEKCDAVLVACNTVTTNIIEELRQSISIPLIGVEPMIKPAVSMSQTGNIAVCATSATLKSKRYRWLKETYAPNTNVVEPDCDSWAYMIEHNRQNELKLEEMVDDLKNRRVDVIVLGCTHYHWIEDELRGLSSSDIKVIQPIEPVLNQLAKVLL